MSALPIELDIELDMPVPAPAPVAPPAPRTDGLIRVRVLPLVSEARADSDDAPLPTALIPQRLIVDYVAALSSRAVKAIRAGEVEQTDLHHIHPEHVVCLRCAVTGATHMQSLAAAMLEIFALRNTDEEWNNLAGTTEQQVISRLRRIAISEADLAEVYGPNWAAVLVVCLRAEVSDLDMMACLTNGHDDILRIGELIADPLATRHALAAYHLATMVSPREHNRGTNETEDLRRNRVARKFAVAVAKVSAGETISWLDHLPSPAL